MILRQVHLGRTNLAPDDGAFLSFRKNIQNTFESEAMQQSLWEREEDPWSAPSGPDLTL